MNDLHHDEEPYYESISLLLVVVPAIGFRQVLQFVEPRLGPYTTPKSSTPHILVSIRQPTTL
jgi:hypothetical protein